MNAAGNLAEREEFMLGLAKHKSTTEAKREGVFYTPNSAARRIAQAALAPFITSSNPRDILTLRVLDPACGAGSFLVEAGLILLERLAELGADHLQNRALLASNCLYGLDKDAAAVETAKKLVRKAILGPCANIRTAHSLVDSFSGLFSGSRKFDCVIGNPPYGLSRDNKMSAAEQRHWRENFKAHASGKLNKYLMFMARGFDLLRDGGSMSFIVPNSWLGIKDGYEIRKLFFETRSLAALDVYHYKLFPRLAVETVVFRAIKLGGCSEVRINHLTREKTETVLLPYSEWSKSPALELPLTWKPSVRKFRTALARSGVSLGSEKSPFLPRIALQAYARGKGEPPQSARQVKEHVFHAAKKDTKRHIKYLEGRDVQRYGYGWSGRYLRHGPWLAEPQTLERFTGPRIIIREIINPPPYLLNACFIDEPALYNKSVLHILPKAGAGRRELLALLAILNSETAGRIIRHFGKKSQRSLFPKLVNQDLKSFPLPAGFESRAPLLAGMSLEMSALTAESARTALQKRIDREVAALYL